MTSMGIGDTLLGLTTVAGLQAQYPNSRVTYTVKCNPRWVMLFLHTVNEPIEPGHTVMYPYHDHGIQMRQESAVGRAEYYARRCGTTAALPRLRPLPPNDVMWAQQFAGAFVLCPFAYHESRRWPIENWVELDHLLTNANKKVVIIGGPNCNDIFKFRSYRIRDESPARIAAVMKVGVAFAGNDSGMTHLAGLVGIPSVAICAGIKGEDIFGIFPNVKALNGPLPCTGCHWLWEHRRKANCKTLDPCASLAAITPQMAFDAIVAVSSQVA